MSGPLAEQLLADQARRAATWHCPADQLLADRLLAAVDPDLPPRIVLHGNCTCGSDLVDALKAGQNTLRALLAAFDRHQAHHGGQS